MRLLLVKLFAQSEGIILPNPPGVSDGSIVSKVILPFIFALAAVLSVLLIVYSGFRFATSNGNPDTINKARNGIYYALIGLVLSLSAFVIVSFVIKSV